MWIGSFLNNLSLRFRKKELVNRDKLKSLALKLQLTFSELNHAKKEGLIALAASIFYYWADILTLYFSFLVFGYHPNIFLIIFGFTISSILSVISAIPYVPGVVEGALAIVFVKLGFPANISLLAVILFRIFSYWLPMPLGIASYLDFRRGLKNQQVENNINNDKLQNKTL